MINQRDVSLTQGILEEDLWTAERERGAGPPVGGRKKWEDKIVGSLGGACK